MQIMGIMLYKVVRDGLSDEMTFEQIAEMRSQAPKILGMKVFRQMGEQSAKALRQEVLAYSRIKKGAQCG